MQWVCTSVQARMAFSSGVLHRVLTGPGAHLQVAQLKASRDKLIAQVSVQLAETDRMSVESAALAQVAHTVICRSRQANV